MAKKIHSIEVEVAFASVEKQSLIPLKVAEGSSVHQAINESGILEEFNEIDLDTLNVGVFGKLCKLDKTLTEGDRVEIYRPLITSPMDARRNRAGKK